MEERPIIQKAEFDYLGYENGSDPQCHDGRVRIESRHHANSDEEIFCKIFGRPRMGGIQGFHCRSAGNSSQNF